MYSSFDVIQVLQHTETWLFLATEQQDTTKEVFLHPVQRCGIHFNRLFVILVCHLHSFALVLRLVYYAEPTGSNIAHP